MKKGMSMPIADILGILADNLRKRKSVVSLSSRKTTAWARGLDIPMGGRTVIYTGHMYQLMPSIRAMEEKMKQIEGSWLSGYFGVGRVINKVVNLAPFLARADADDTRTYNDILRGIVRLLRAADISFGYLYDQELYSGALLYDEGVETVFEQHALRVHTLFKTHGVKSVITVDPHTTNILRDVYPAVIKGFDLEVKSYLEVLAEKQLTPEVGLAYPIVIHDSCVYARYEGIIDEPRNLLTSAGVEFAEPEYSRALTYCCGGPVESLYPRKARSVADNRIEQLAKAGKHVATMCPICLLNLKEAAKGQDIEVRDISEYLAAAVFGVDGWDNNRVFANSRMDKEMVTHAE
jgi:Fe-S oxidoreductase